MLIYILLYLAVLSAGSLGNFIFFDPYKKWTFISLSSLFIIVAGFRFETGYDWGIYEHYYELANVNVIFSSLKAEPLFQVLLVSFKSIGLALPYLLLVVAIISISLKCFFVYKYSPLPLFSLIVLLSFFLAGEMGQIRQMLAIGVCLMSVKWILDEKLIHAFLIIVIAGLLHYSAIFFLFIIPLHKVKINWKWVLALTITAALMNITAWFGLLPELINYFPEYFGHKFSFYYTPANLAFTKQTFLYRILFFTLAWYILGNSKSSIVQLSLKIYLFGILFYLVFSTIENLAGRGTNYFKIFEVILVPAILMSVKERKVLFYGLMLLFIAYHSRHYFEALIAAKEYYVPYKSWLFTASF